MLEIQKDLKGISNILVVIEVSDYYNEEDAGIFRLVRNSIDFTKSRFEDLIEKTKETA